VEQASNPIWLFDGVCVLCSRSVQILLQHERDHDLHFVAIQSELGRALATQHGIDPDNPASFIYLRNGTAYEASDAVLNMLDHTRWTLRWLKLARILPKPLRDKAYYALAKNRYRLFGKHDICMLPNPEQRHRFVLQ
jgi:predicted DCC family thiol-disulfide oxidoreductase YuxK